MRNFFYNFFNMTTSKSNRVFMLMWTGFFSSYELFMTMFSQWHLFHFAFLVVQVTVFIAFFRAKTIA